MTRLPLVFFAVSALACAGETSVDSSRPPGSRGVTQGGAQDIAHFRSLVEDGVVPAPEVLDEVGFFAEHALDQPPADCGSVLCAHPMLAVAPRFGEGTWTMAFVSLNTPVDPELRPREPLHVVLAVEESSVVSAVLGPGAPALDSLVQGLVPGDLVSVVSFGAGARITLAGAPLVDVPDLGDLLVSPVAAAEVDLYAGIAAAWEAVDQQPGIAARVVLLTSGAASGGSQDAGRIEELAGAVAREGTSFSVIGLGSTYDEELPVRIADLGVGTYAYAESGTDLQQILAQEGLLRLLPLATDVELRVIPEDGYGAGRLYGVRRAGVEDGVAVMRMPALFIGARTGAMDVGMGRRGGGGGLFVELVGDAGRAASIGRGQAAFRLEGSYTDVDSGEVVTFSQSVNNDLAPGERPAVNWPNFSMPDYGKAFMMLNMYLALRTSLTLHAGGDCGASLGVGIMMEPTIAEWQRRFDDPDIAADAELLEELLANVDNECRAFPLPPSNVETGCFFL
jgi:Ca-activated chloride channel family protein